MGENRRETRTDLALETHELCSKAQRKELGGVAIEEQNCDGVRVTRVIISNEEGAEEMQKPIGTYITVDIPPNIHSEQHVFEQTCGIVSREISSLISVGENDLVMIVGLGNWNITPDSLGPKVLSSILVTRHMFELVPEEIEDGVRPVCALTPGVLGLTGIETCEVIRGVVDRVKPALVIAIDALASRRLDRISTTIQISDTGISPGAGIGNRRAGLDANSLGVPVLALGVPTVVDAATMASDTIDLVIDHLMEQLPNDSSFYSVLKNVDREAKHTLIQNVLTPSLMGNLIVTPKEVDDIIEDISELIANSINIALHPSIHLSDINKYA